MILYQSSDNKLLIFIDVLWLKTDRKFRIVSRFPFSFSSFEYPLTFFSNLPTMYLIDICELYRISKVPVSLTGILSINYTLDWFEGKTKSSKLKTFIRYQLGIITQEQKIRINNSFIPLLKSKGKKQTMTNWSIFQVSRSRSP